MAKKKNPGVKKGKKRGKYDEKLKVNASWEEVIKIAVRDDKKK